MTWTNAFDLGACTVEVYHTFDPTTLTYSGVLAKGSAETFTDGTYDLSIGVDAGGVVTLANVGAQSIEDDMDVRVLPSYALGAMAGARALAPLCVSPSGGKVSADGSTFDNFANGDALIDVSAQTPYSQITARTLLGGPRAGTPVLQFTPEFDMADVVTAPDESMTVAQNSSDNAVAPVITLNGTPTAADSLAIDAGPAHGMASVSGTSLLYTQNTGYFGPDSFDYTATIGGTQSNVATVSVTVAPAPCAELGRVTRIYASGYDRARVHDGRLVRGESRCLVVEFNGAIPPARSITSVTWRCNNPASIAMSNARIQAGARSVAVDVIAGWGCDTAIKCEATLDNGERYMQLIRLAVMDSPWFGDETTASGPTTLTSP